jgi:hypothetical protein
MAGLEEGTKEEAAGFKAEPAKPGKPRKPEGLLAEGMKTGASGRS